MKATIADITYEGTYEEIKAIADHMTTRVEGEPLKQGIWGLDESLRLLEESEYQQRTQRSTGVHEMQLKPTCQCAASCSCNSLILI